MAGLLLWWTPWTSDSSNKPDPEQPFCHGLVKRGELEELQGPDRWRLTGESDTGTVPGSDLYICDVLSAAHEKDPRRLEPTVLILSFGQFFSPEGYPGAPADRPPTPGAPNVPYFDDPLERAFRHPLPGSLPGYIELETKNFPVGYSPEYAVRLALPACASWTGPDSSNPPRYMQFLLRYGPWDAPVPEAAMATAAVTTANRLLDANNCDKPRFVVP